MGTPPDRTANLNVDMGNPLKHRYATLAVLGALVVGHGFATTNCLADEASAIELLTSNRIFASLQRNENGDVIAVRINCTHGLWDDPHPYDKTKWLPQFAEHLRAFPKLKEVTISNWAYSDEDMRHVATIPQLTHFHNDTAFGNAEPFTGSGLKHLVMPAALRRLSLQGDKIDDESLRHAGRLKSLDSLRLYSKSITDKGLKHLGRLDLRELNVTTDRVTGEGFASFAEMRQMRSLKLAGNQIDRGLAHFAEMQQLQLLDLHDNQLGDDELSHLAKLTQLTELNLSRNKITDAGLEHLRELTELRTLNLSANQIRGPGVKHLAALVNVEKVYLSQNAEMGDEVLETVMALPKLKSVSVSESNVRIDALRKFRQQRPEVKIGFSARHALGLKDHWHVRLDDNWRVVGVGFSGLSKGQYTDDKDLALLENNPEFAGVKFLSFPFPQRITGKGLVHLQALKQLEKLHLDECDVGDEGLKHIGQIASLETLEIDEGGITGEGLKHLAGLTELRHLELTNSDLNDADMAFLRGLTKLETMKLAGNYVSAKGVAQYLTEAKNLTRLDLSSDTFRGDHVITGEALKRLQEETEP